MLIYNSFMPTKKCSEFLQNPQQFVRICKWHAQHLQFFGAESWHPKNVTTPCVKSVALSQTLVWRAGSWWAWWVEVSWWVNCHWGWYSPCVRVCRQLAWSKNTPFYQCQPPRGTARQTVNSRQPSPCGCGSTLPTDDVVANSLSTFRRLSKRIFYSSNHIWTSSTDIIQLVIFAVVTPLRPR